MIYDCILVFMSQDNLYNWIDCNPNLADELKQICVCVCVCVCTLMVILPSPFALSIKNLSG